MTDMLQEFCDSRGVTMRVDRPSGVIRGVKVLGLESRNGRSYLPEALAQAAPLYEDAKVNVNHPRGNPGGPRDYQDRIGAIRNVAMRPGEGLFADFHFNPKHALAEQLIWDAEHATENVGFSHNVEARCARRGDRLVVEAITRVQSVDLVADPATTRGLFESQDAVPPSPPVEGQGETANEASVDDQPVTESSPSHLPTGERTNDSDPNLGELNRLRQELERLHAQEAARQKKSAAERLLHEFGLPEADASDPWAKTVTSQRFFETLLAAADEPTMRALVEDRARLVRILSENQPSGSDSERRPRCRDQHQVYAAAPLTRKHFVAAIT
ncbi:MAG: hypothetical protein ABFC96_07765 [Thermoguttaceae bacterium]